RRGQSLERVQACTGIDRFFLTKIRGMVELENMVAGLTPPLSVGASGEDRGRPKESPGVSEFFLQLKKKGFSDRYLASLLKIKEDDLRTWRQGHGLVPTYKMVDTCAAEFEAVTPYFYSCYEWEDEALPRPENPGGQAPNHPG
ncbi:MAG: hypothetical protein M1553_09295, partial [Firmicutes bacterium]|nr:hypothetical protein [Bacillota bacterium]